MTKGGALTVRAESIGPEASSWCLPEDIAASWLCQADGERQGCGMDEKTQTRIFEPFFTTKKGSLGVVRGLGLSVVRAIMKRWGGLVRVQSQPGSGTNFEVHLPQDEKDTPEAGAHPASCVSPRRSGNGGTVLLVEDEP